MRNMACNLNTVCKELNIFGKDIQKFKKPKSPNYTADAIMNEGGIYTMLYAENWTGNFMKYFTKEILAHFRMLKAYDMFYCIQNRVTNDHFEKTKKRKCYGGHRTLG